MDISESTTTTTFLLFEDQGETLPAGSIFLHTPLPDDDPQLYSSTYQFTAGTQQGAHGSYSTSYGAESGKSTYQETWADGSTDSGSSSWSAAGDYTWTSQSQGAGLTYNSRGTFRADSSGVTHTDSSDGYTWDFTYRADGSGRGKVTGPDAGLPVVIIWDGMGNTSIIYADGTREEYSYWFYFDGLPVSGGSGGTASNSKGLMRK